jgi:dephospho-CoA kinase
MLVVGLTGGIGAGKSSVARLLIERGAVVIDADAVAREVVEPDGLAHAGVAARFGPAVVTPDGFIDRAALADIVFHDPAALDDLNGIVHPAVNQVIARRLAAEATTDHVVVLEVPLWVEKGYHDAAGVIVVDASEETVLRRLVEQRGMDEADVRRRAAAQASRHDRLAKADFVIDNDGSREDLSRQVDDAWTWIQSLADSGHRSC